MARHHNLSRRWKQARLDQVVDQSKIIDRRIYNCVMCGVVLYGLIVNAILCSLFAPLMVKLDPLSCSIGNFIVVAIGVAIAVISSNAIISFVGYNLVVIPIGMTLSEAVYYVARSDVRIVVNAFWMTFLIVLAMSAVAILFPDFVSHLGRILFVCLIGLVLAGIVVVLFRRGALLYAYAGTAVFSLYVAYDVWQAQMYPSTLDNAVDSALDIYLDIVNLFLEILKILGSSKSSRRRR